MERKRVSEEDIIALLDNVTKTPLVDEFSDSDTEAYFSSDSADTDSESDSFDELDEIEDAQAWCRIVPDDCGPPRPRFPFKGNSGLQVTIEHDPLQYLQLFFDSKVIEIIVMETNRYASQCQESRSRPFSRSRRWEPVTADDIWVFLGLLILQGIVGKPVQKWYWSTNKLLETPIFGNIMTECRFSLIMKYLHFTDKEQFDDAIHPAPKLNKIWELFQVINSNFQRVYIPDRDVCVDESLMAYKGRVSWIQYIASKRARYGLKFYMLCESKSGYIWNSILYTGKGTKWNEKYNGYGMATASVLSLVDPLLDQGYCITMDNFYTSPELFDILVKRSTDAYGTVRQNRRGMPVGFHKESLERGALAAWQRGKLMALKWKDKKDVALLSTIHDASCVNVKNKFKKIVSKPTAVVDYNCTMGGVDRADQAMTFYPVVRKQQKKYYKKIFRHLLEQCLWNAYILFRQNSERPVSHADFTWKVVAQILAKHQPTVTPTKAGRRSTTSVNPERLRGRHFIEYCPPSAMKQNAVRKCIICCSRVDRNGKKVRKETRYYCPDCNVGLCLVPCFKVYHTCETF